MLYLRMIVSVIVSLYTSRVVLATLGVEDYGIYSAVAGVIGMIAFLNTSMSSASARFITFYLGQGDTTMLKRTFSSAVTVHLLLAVFMTVIFETAGVWYVNNMLVLPEGSLTAANWVFRFAVISMFICIVRSPYAGAVIAYESMDFYACMEIVNVILKLLIVYMLLVFDCNKLILYSALTLMISAVSFGCYTFYVTTRFKDCRLSSRPDRETVKSLLSFSGFDLFGNMSNAVGVQGYALVLNYFLGAAVNAANGIAILVQGTLKGFAFSIALAFRPQIIKQYASQTIEDLQPLIKTATDYTLCMYLTLVTPLIFEAPFVLSLWLGNVPQFTVGMTRIILIATAFNVASFVINSAIQATGKIRTYSILTGICSLLQPLSLFMLFRLDAGVINSYAVMIPLSALSFIVSLVILKINICRINVTAIVTGSYLPVTAVTFATSVVTVYVCNLFDEGWLRLIVTCGISIVCFGLFFIFFILNNQSRRQLLAKLKLRSHE